MSTDLRRSLKRGVAGVTAGLLVASGAIALAAPASAQAAPEGFDFTRIAGADRYGTAGAIARERFNNDADTVVLASGVQFPDALAGNFLAGSLDAPILLTAPGFIPEVTSTTLDELNTSNIRILGGTDAVSTRVETELRADGFSVTRIAGTDRFKTAAAVAAAGDTVGTVNGQRTAVLANGLNFADALTAGPLAVDSLLPVLLTEPTTLRPEASASLRSENIQQVLIVGGTDAVSAAQETQLRRDGFAVVRLGGNTRADTAVEIAEFAKANLGFGDDHINLARGDDFADALTGGPHAGAEMAPIVLTGNPTTSAPATLAFLRENCETLRDGHIFGGLAAVSEPVEMENEEAATCDAVAPSVVTVDGDNNTVVAGENFTGTISTDDGQNIENVSVSGRCIDDNANLDETDTAGGSDFGFSIPVNADAATGDCVLTFVVTLEGGEQVTVTQTINVVAPQEQPATPTSTVGFEPVQQQTATDAPELVVATVDSQTDDNVVIRFRFDEDISNRQPTLAFFQIFAFDGTEVATPTTAIIDPANLSDVLVSFDADRDEFAAVTVATVDFDAVEDADGHRNPEGDSGLQNVVFNSGSTTAPDLIGVGEFNATTDEVEFFFDENVATATADLFRLIPITSGDPVLVGDSVRIDDRERTIVRVTFDNPANDEDAEVGTTGDEGRIDSSTRGETARAAVEAGAVSDGNGDTNPLQTIDVNNGGNTNEPDLVSVTFDLSRDEATFLFDEPVQLAGSATATATLFQVFDRNGDETGGIDVDRSAGNTRAVVVTFADNVLEDALGASVQSGAVQSTTGTVNGMNEVDQVVVENNQEFPAGLTTRPDLLSARVQQGEVAGDPDVANQLRVVFVFDEDVDSADADQFFITDESGDRTMATRVQVNSQDRTQVFAVFGVTSDADINAAVVATVDDNAVSDGSVDAAGVDNGGNVEGFTLLTR